MSRRRHAIKRHICVRCGGNAVIFTDEKSITEYHKSGYCQRCQDWFFVEPEREGR